MAITRRAADVSVHDLSTETGSALQLMVMAVVSVSRRGESMLRELARKIDAFQERLGRAVSFHAIASFLLDKSLPTPMGQSHRSPERPQCGQSRAGHRRTPRWP
jgi:hypothetical protein